MEIATRQRRNLFIMGRKLVLGIGINDTDYQLSHKINGHTTVCPFYLKWNNMLNRCYSSSYIKAKPTYKGCTVCEEWLTFSNFKSWMEKQDWEDKHLDKDLLFKGNKLYSPETCVFISRQINMFINENDRTRGAYLVGVAWNKPRNKFTATCSNPLTKKKEHLGMFTDEFEAHKAWLKRKLEHAQALAALQTDKRVADALINLYAVYTTIEECVVEVAHQRAQGMPGDMLYCDELKEGE